MACGLQASMGLGGGLNAAGGRTSASDPNQGQGPGDGNDVWVGNNGRLPRSDKPLAGQGKTTPTMVTGERREGGDETYVEVRGPASLGARSRIPYSNVLVQYRKRAEEAIQRRKIPKSRQKRVKQYFESLQGGSK